MRFIRNLLYTLLGLFILAAILIYFLAQTSYAAKWISQWVNDNTPYQLTLGKLNYNITEPYRLVLNDVELSQKQQQPLLSTQKATLGLTSSQWDAPLHFSILELENGTLNLSSKTTTSLGISSDRFQLRNMTVNVENSDINIQGTRVNGGIVPWILSEKALPDSNNRFEFSADKLTINGVEVHRALVQGSVKDQQIILNNVGADLANGLLTGNGKRTAEGKWTIDNLRLSDVKYQSPLELSQLFEQFNQLIGQSEINVNRIDILNANIQGKDWALSDFSLSVKDLRLEKGQWLARSGTVLMNAYDVVYGDEHLLNPVLSLGLEDNNVRIKQFSSRWQDGLVRASGVWQRDSQTLTLDDVAFTSLLYTLPKEWKETLKQTQPDWLRELYINKLAVNRTIAIDINPEFPFQFTAIDSSGSNLHLVKDHQFGLWHGKFDFNAAEATLNKIDLRHPSIRLNATQEAITVDEISAFTKEGLIEGKASLSQQAERQFSLTLAGRAVPVNILQSWGWQSIPLQGNGNIDLQLNGRLVDKQTKEPNLTGSLKMMNDTGQQLTQYPLSQKDIPPTSEITQPNQSGEEAALAPSSVSVPTSTQPVQTEKQQELPFE